VPRRNVLVLETPTVDLTPWNLYPERVMEVHFTPDTQARLEKFAASEGKDASQVVEETITRVLQQRTQFLEAVERGIAAADRGEVIEHDEVVNRIERLLNS
jgi:predicted transcriptional regulator